MSFSRAVKIASEADKPLIRGFEKLWKSRGWQNMHEPIVTENDEGFIAFAPKEWRGKEWTKIYYIYVKPEARRKGVAKKLLASVKGNILLVSQMPNAAIESLAIQANYKLEGIFPNEFGNKDVYYTKTEDRTKDNGGPTSYYDFEPGWTEAGDIIEGRNMNFNQGNMFKVAFCFNIGRHSATNYERELNKIIYFANRELKRISNGN